MRHNAGNEFGSEVQKRKKSRERHEQGMFRKEIEDHKNW